MLRRGFVGVLAAALFSALAFAGPAVAAGTKLVRSINPGGAHSNPDELVNVGGTLFFSAGDGTNGPELWKSNGTAAGTKLVKNINPGSPGSFPNQLITVGRTLFFAADDGTNGRELWKSVP
jgi:ELWxxDGT repeat protein